MSIRVVGIESTAVTRMRYTPRNTCKAAGRVEVEAKAEEAAEPLGGSELSHSEMQRWARSDAAVGPSEP